MTRHFLALASAILLGILVAAVDAQDAPDPDPPGVKVGEKAPDFHLMDQHGKLHSLQSLLKPGQSLAIVFHRSADW